MWPPAQILLWNPWPGNELLWMPKVVYLCSTDYCFIPCLLIVFIHSFNQKVENDLVGKHCLTDNYWVKACLLALSFCFSLCNGEAGLSCLAYMVKCVFLQNQLVRQSPEVNWCLFFGLQKTFVFHYYCFFSSWGHFHGNLLMCLPPPLPPAPFYLQMECEGDLVLTLPRGCAPVVWTGHTSKPTLAVTTCHHQTLLRTQHSSAVSLRLFFFSALALILGRHLLTPLILP